MCECVWTKTFEVIKAILPAFQNGIKHMCICVSGRGGQLLSKLLYTISNNKTHNYFYLFWIMISHWANVEMYRHDSPLKSMDIWLVCNLTPLWNQKSPFFTLSVSYVKRCILKTTLKCSIQAHVNVVVSIHCCTTGSCEHGCVNGGSFEWKWETIICCGHMHKK